MSEKWSQRLSAELAASFPPAVIDWLDGDICHALDFPHLGEFNEPIAPEQLLDPSSSAVWGGLMLPDTLPLLSNGCGDVVSLRFDSQGRVSEVLRWNHEGGDWRPFGNTLAEAVLCDIATVKVEQMADSLRDDSRAQHPLEDWAIDWTRRTTGPTLNWSDPCNGDSLSVFQCLLDAGICEVVARRERCRANLTSGLARRCMEIGGVQIAERLGVHWSVVREWLWDITLIPEEHHQPLSDFLDMPIVQVLQQDWNEASEEARRVCELRPDLAWTYAVLGWAAERDGDLRRAATHYLDGLKKLGTSCAFQGRVEKGFIVQRLGELRDHLSNDGAADPYLQAAEVPSMPETISSGIRHYWMQRAESAAEAGQYDRAYQCYYSAGWDDHFMDDIDRVLDGLIRSAEAAGYTTLCRLAKLHLASLQATQRPAKNALQTPRNRSWIRTLIARILGNLRRKDADFWR